MHKLQNKKHQQKQKESLGSMAKDLKNVNLNGLSVMQKKQMQKHKVHHTKKHLSMMASEMRKGKTFKQSHNKAQRAVGK